MAETTKIEWATSTFNPWTGCTKVSPGCANCYAEALSKRTGLVKWGKGQPRRRTTPAYWRGPVRWNREAERARKLWAQRGAVGAPPARPRVFCASLADWLDDEVSVEWIADLIALVAATPDLNWLLLSKRPHLWRGRVTAAWRDVLIDRGAGTPEKRAAYDMADRWLDGEAPANVWVGTTVEDQERADQRVPQLLAIPARVRFLSCEPLLGPVDLRGALAVAWQCSGCRGLFPDPWMKKCPACDRVDYWTGSHPFNPPGGQRGPGVHWIIAGGESGHGARPMHPAWVRSLRDQAQTAGVAFHFKQWGETRPIEPEAWREEPGYGVLWPDGTRGSGLIGDTAAAIAAGCVATYRFGKKGAGRELDGRTWDELPEVPHAR